MKKIIQNTIVTFVLFFSVNAIKAQCTASFTYTLGTNGTVNFSSTSVGTSTATLYNWNFGDGTIYQSFGSGIAAHTYSSNQVFQVYLSISDSISYTPACYSSYSDTLMVNNSSCSGNLAFNYYVGLNGNVYFNDASTGVPSTSSYSFSFGDGTTSSGPYSSVHTYSAAGLYSVSITATDQFSVCTYSTSQTISVSINICPLGANFSYTIGSNGNVNFSSTSTGTTANSNYYWNFGDGTGGNGVNPSHTFSSNGFYNVHLTVQDSIQFGCMDTITQTINLSGCFTNVSFNMYKDSTQLPNIVWDAYINYPSNAVSAVWSWGDGTSTAGMMFPSHTYSATGFYNICVTVSVACGATATACNNTNIYRMSDQASSPVTIHVMATPTGIKSNSAEPVNVLVYPNPGNGEFEIRTSGLGESIIISVCNIVGQEVYRAVETVNPADQINKINLSDLPAGTYFLRVHNSLAAFNSKLIITK